MRIITRLNIGGPARHALLLAGALSGRALNSHLVWGRVSTGEGEFEVPRSVLATHVPELRREIHPIDDVKAVRTLSRLMRRWRPAVVHTHLAKARVLSTIAARRTRVPILIHTFHGHVLEGYFSDAKTRSFLAVERWTAQRADVLVAVSPAVRDELLSLGIGRPEQWRVVPLGLDLEALLTHPVDSGEARRSLGLPHDRSIVGIVGRLTAIKNHELFLQVAARIAQERKDALFIIAGDGELRGALEEEARRLLGDRCRFLGWIFDLPTLYAASDVVLLTSLNEGTPVALIEAGAAGRAVVATDVGGVRDVVIDGVTGLLARSGDVEQLAAHVLRILGNGDLATSLGSTGREHVARRFTIDRLADDLAALYRQLLQQKGITA